MKTNFNKIEESGRSMVEMLGVLAVMGVLSVGGVAMYTNAMNKYRANELLNESSKRAVVIATQILSGKSVSSDMINQFDNNGTTFTGVEAVGTNQFKLTLSGVDDDVCTQLKATVGSNTIIQEVGDKCAYLTFNNDLSKGTPEISNTPSVGTGCSDNRALCGNTCCEEGQVCGNSNGNYECLTPEGNGCVKNSDCDSGEYCALEGFNDPTDDNCVPPKAGSCISVSNLSPFTHNNKTFYVGDVGSVGDNNNNWWSAENLCQAHGKKLASLTSLGLSNDGYSCSPSGDCLESRILCAHFEEGWEIEEVESCDDFYGGLCTKRYFCEEDPDRPLKSCSACEGECEERLLRVQVSESDSNTCLEGEEEITQPGFCSDQYVVESCESCGGDCLSTDEFLTCFKYENGCPFYEKGLEGVFWLQESASSCEVKTLNVFDTYEDLSSVDRDGNVDQTQVLCED